MKMTPSSFKTTANQKTLVSTEALFTEEPLCQTYCSSPFGLSIALKNYGQNVSQVLELIILICPKAS